MEAAAALEGDPGISLHELRPLVGAEVAADTAGGRVEGTLLSCTARSAVDRGGRRGPRGRAPPPAGHPAALIGL